MDEFDEIYRYTNEDALADGVFVDISFLAKQFGFYLPFIATTNFVEKMVAEDRIKEVLIMFNAKIHAGEDVDNTMVVLVCPSVCHIYNKGRFYEFKKYE